MKTKLTFLLLLITGVISAQRTIRVRPQHQKEAIYTLKTGENLMVDESKISFNISGANYDFTTIYKNATYKNSRGKRVKIRNNAVRGGSPRDYKNWRVKEKNQKYTVVHKAKNKSYGSFDGAYYVYDRSIKLTVKNQFFSTKSDLYGMVYHQNQMDTINGEVKFIQRHYYVVKPGEKPEGPYKQARILYAANNQFIYRYTTAEGVYLNKNGKIKGPYQNVLQYANAEGSETDKQFYFYQQNEMWYCSFPPLKDSVFTRSPYFHGNGFSVHSASTPGLKYFIHVDGRIRQDSPQQFSLFNQQQNELAFSRAPTAKNNVAWLYDVAYNGKSIGRFQANALPALRVVVGETDYFTKGLIKIDTVSEPMASNSGEKALYFYSPAQGLTGPFNDQRNNTVYFYDDAYFVFSYNDSTLRTSNGKLYENIIATDFSDYPKSWWMLKADGDIHQPYKNGKKSNASTYPKRFKNYKTPDKPFVLAQRDTSYYIKPQGSGRLLGPVKKNSQIVLAKDQQNYIECLRNGGIILLNDKAISTGFNVVYNQQLNAFNWVSLDDQNRIYLHTYELD